MPRECKSPLFQQRHYEWLAAWLRENDDIIIARSLAYHLARDNPKFKEHLFIERAKAEPIQP